MAFKTYRRSLAALVVAAAVVCTPAASAQDYPTRPVKIVVASVAGSAPDVLARLIAEKLGAALGQPVIVDNKPGAGGVVGIDAVAKAAPDGYTLAIGHDGTMAINTIVYKSLPYDPATDFAAIAPLGLNEFVLLTNPATGVRTVKEMIAYAKARPGKVSYGSAGVGTPNHLFMEQLLKAADVSMTHIPYKGGAAAVADLVGGQTEFMLAGIAPALPHLKAGKLVAIAVTQPTRSKVLPDVPTVAETIPGFGMKTWFGLFAPAKTPPAIVQKLNAEVRKVLADKDVQDKLTAQGIVIETGDPATLAATVKSDIARYKALAPSIKLDSN
ncbi:MAG: tripartite tricarboxylate transporter substrate binding protein [Burkholderiales bacterium]|nr:tripartite tricarboxylate transporter substrate binding protein [Burkholderiales bacterium]